MLLGTYATYTINYYAKKTSIRAYIQGCTKLTSNCIVVAFFNGLNRIKCRYSALLTNGQIAKYKLLLYHFL